MNELTLPLDTSLLKQIPGKLQGTDLAPPSYQSLDHCSLELEDLSSSSSFYHTIHHPKRRSALQSQPKPRPMSMPIFFPDALTTPSSTNHEPLDELFSSSAIAKWQHRRSCVIVPREEEGCENLPPYECTVYKKGKVNVKMLTDANGNKVTNRTWRRLHMELWGTVLRIHALSFFRATIGKDPIDIISLAGAEACRAFDYTKKPFVIRLSILSGIELLIQLPDHASMVSWIEQLQSGINISLDLEHRPMPKFITLPPRRGCENGILTRRLLESERRREQRRQTQQEFLA
ncbi:hypothetical protein DM01DRAFT_1288029 [Hesseltinella vesiculosa]|uniref:PH domain-containing protein n=1 Tax=Hesseltinella vesiculosa TaxID=101127 RepID=A0A1X2GGA7_9FUNG|nr:hypothetical protein DM01DRAFT_1288029 [Hesseltinella vesiculosa]